MIIANKVSIKTIVFYLQLIRKWTGLPSAMRMSRVPILVGLKHSPAVSKHMVGQRKIATLCYWYSRCSNCAHQESEASMYNRNWINGFNIMLLLNKCKSQLALARAVANNAKIKSVPALALVLKFMLQ